MLIDVTKLKSGMVSFLSINQDISFTKEQLETTDLLDLKDVKVEGEISVDSLLNYFLNITVSGMMILECAITLKPVSYPFSVLIEGNIEDLLEDLNNFVKKSENTIDIFPIIWENILMEIPMRVVSENASLEQVQGEGWRLITDRTESRNLNPELQKLEDLLK